MTALVITREQAFAEARAVLDRARVRLAADYAAGRLTGERLAAYERVRAIAAARQQPHAAAAA